MQLINVKVIEGVFSGSQKQEMVKEHEQDFVEFWFERKVTAVPQERARTYRGRRDRTRTSVAAAVRPY